jgi:alpha-tubulin suppressor-like RCC1 family protein
MSTNNESNVLSQLSNDFINNINIIFIFDHNLTEILFVTKDDKCYGFGENDLGVLGLGHNRQVKEPKIIEELCYKQIISFANSSHHVMALTSDGKVYSWGQNHLGVLGN